MAFASGDIVGDYRVLGPLGAGGMGTVYRVQHAISDRLEAMKVLLPDVSFAGIDERFLREIKVQASLQHPHIAQLHNAFRHGEQIVMVMELVEGTSLRDMMRAGQLPVSSSVSYISQVLSALEYAHSRGVIHRDLKPSNIVVTPNGSAKLLDFGLAMVTLDQRITQTGAVVGSLPYMSPEQIRGESVDARSDIYSLGATFYEVLTSKCPIEAVSAASMLMGHLERRPVPPMQVNPNIPPALSAAVSKSLEKLPGDRFQSAAAFLDQLHQPTVTMHVPSALSWDAAKLDRITRELAQYVGPIAKVLVTRASRQTANPRDLCQRLSEEIPSPTDRTKFLTSTR